MHIVLPQFPSVAFFACTKCSFQLSLDSLCIYVSSGDQGCEADIDAQGGDEELERALIQRRRPRLECQPGTTRPSVYTQLQMICSQSHSIPQLRRIASTHSTAAACIAPLHAWQLHSKHLMPLHHTLMLLTSHPPAALFFSSCFCCGDCGCCCTPAGY